MVGGLVFYPVVGAALGLVAAAAARLAAPLGAVAAAMAAVAVLAGASGGRTLRELATATGAVAGRSSAIGVAVAGTVLVLKLWALARLPDGARTLALPLAGMLGRWAVVVQCYGGTPAGAGGLAAQMIGRARLREFGWASAVAFGVTLAALDAVGLLVVLAATLTAVGIRVLAHRRAGGMSGPVLGASTELVETAALVVLAALARA
jgi:adenosylcobinamide-GDP ribazoletransferase